MEAQINQFKKFLVDSIEMPYNSYTVIENFADPSAFNTDELKTYVKKFGKAIVQEIDESNDKKRIMYTIDGGKKSSSALPGVPELFNKVTNLFNTGSEIRWKRKGSLLLSLSDCMRQDMHADNPIETDEEFDKAFNSFICILALEENTYLYQYDNDLRTESKVYVAPGSLFIGRGIYFYYHHINYLFVNTYEYHYDFQIGCFLHAGHEYKVENVRFHFYIDKSNGNVRRKDEETYFYTPVQVVLKEIWDDKFVSNYQAQNSTDIECKLKKSS